VLVPNEHELDALGGAVALLDGGVGTLVVTRGGAGVDVLQRRDDGSLDEWHLAPFRASPVDTTGAGDAFCGALAAAIADGRALPHAVRFAAAAGALATETHGAVPSLPHRAAVDALVESVSC
jgi:ribokinase